MNIQQINVSDIKIAGYNPRKDLKPADKEYKHIEKSISKFGQVEPLVWNKRSGYLVSGHQRFKILMADNPEEIECSVVDLSEDDERALNIALNKIDGKWDSEKLAELLGELQALPDFDIETVGFTLDEIGNTIIQDDIVPFTLDDFEFEEIKEPCWFVVRGDLDDYEEIKKHITKLKNNVVIEGSLDGQLKQ
jgi:ParB-like chromosome segregation protein Spo0J